MGNEDQREPFSVQSDALDPEVAAELEAAFRSKEAVQYEGSPWLVQKVETHRDPGPGAQIQRFTLIPADPESLEEGDAG